jgi:hypothetical protein
MEARIESLGRTLLRTAEIAVRRGRVGAQEYASMRRLTLTTPPPKCFKISAQRAFRRPCAADFSMSLDRDVVVCFYPTHKEILT